MPGTFIYVVSGMGRDFYSAMTRVSAASVQLSNSGAKIVVACDASSATALRRERDPLLDEVDETIVCEIPSGNDGFRNKFVKTQLRNLVQGQFLFLDSDILVRRSVIDLFSLQTDIACTPNHSSNFFEVQIWQGDRDALATAGWKTRSDVYVNGGVIFYSDTAGARRFAADWHRKWLVSYRLTKSHRDQPALNAAIFETKPILTVLPHRFNAQLLFSPAVVVDAFIWHFYAATFNPRPTTEFEVLVRRLLTGAKLEKSDVSEIMHRDHPWRRNSWLDDLVARRMVKNGHLSPEYQMWFRDAEYKASCAVY